MSKVQVWRGNDIGHGKKGGVLTIGGHEIKVGQAVPVNLLSTSAINTFKKKGAIVYESTKVGSDDEELLAAKKLVESAISNLTTAKKLLTESNKEFKQAKTNVIDQQKIIDNLPEGNEEGQLQAEESLIELNGILRSASDENETLKLAKDNAEKASIEAKEALSAVIS